MLPCATKEEARAGGHTQRPEIDDQFRIDVTSLSAPNLSGARTKGGSTKSLTSSKGQWGFLYCAVLHEKLHICQQHLIHDHHLAALSQPWMGTSQGQKLGPWFNTYKTHRTMDDQDTTYYTYWVRPGVTGPRAHWAKGVTRRLSRWTPRALHLLSDEGGGSHQHRSGPACGIGAKPRRHRAL